MSEPAAPSAPTVPPKLVCTFGAAWPTPADAPYAEGEALGAALARAGFNLINGGYGGTMEATAKGHRETAAAGGMTDLCSEGVIVPTLFKSGDKSNPFITKTTPTTSLMRRIEHMVESAPYFVIMTGNLGTLTELAVAWTKATLAKGKGIAPPRIYAYREPWQKAVTGLIESLRINDDWASHVRYVDNWEEAVARITADHEAAVAAAAAASSAAKPELGSGGAAAAPSAP